jgi:hypothetical protein
MPLTILNSALPMQDVIKKRSNTRQQSDSLSERGRKLEANASFSKQADVKGDETLAVQELLNDRDSMYETEHSHRRLSEIPGDDNAEPDLVLDIER